MMSSNGYALPLRLDVKASSLLRRIIIVAHGCALLLIGCLSICVVVMLTLIMLIFASLFFYLHRFRAGGTYMPRVIILEDLAKIKFQYAAGEKQPGEIIADSYFHPWLVILNIKMNDGKKRSLPLLRDSLPHDQHRRMRVYLRLQQYRINADKQKQAAV